MPDDSSQNEFDVFIREVGEMEASDFSPDSGLGPCSPPYDFRSTPWPPTEGSGSQGPKRLSTDKDGLPVITLANRASVYDPVERESDVIPPRFPAHRGVNQVR